MDSENFDVTTEGIDVDPNAMLADTADHSIIDKERHVPREILSNMEGTKCKICGTVGKKRCDTFRHIRNVHLKTNLYECNNCDFGSEQMGALRVHFKRAHANENANVNENDYENDNVDDTFKPPSEMIMEDDMELDFEAAVPAKEVITKKRGAAMAANARFKKQKKQFGSNESNAVNGQMMPRHSQRTLRKHPPQMPRHPRYLEQGEWVPEVPRHPKYQDNRQLVPEMPSPRHPRYTVVL